MAGWESIEHLRLHLASDAKVPRCMSSHLWFAANTAATPDNRRSTKFVRMPYMCETIAKNPSFAHGVGVINLRILSSTVRKSVAGMKNCRLGQANRVLMKIFTQRIRIVIDILLLTDASKGNTSVKGAHFLYNIRNTNYINQNAAGCLTVA